MHSVYCHHCATLAMNNDDGSNWEWLRDYLSALTMQSDWCFLVLVTFWQIIHCSLQEMRAVAEKPHDSIVKFDTYRNVQQHHAVLPAIARLLFIVCICENQCPIQCWLLWTLVESNLHIVHFRHIMRSPYGKITYAYCTYWPVWCLGPL